MPIQTAADSISNSAGSPYGFKNRIINGAMVIDQRNAGASGTATGYTIDRWGYYGVQSSKGTWQQNAGSVTPPTGFTNYLGFTSSSSYTTVSGDLFELYQSIEGYNIADLDFGKSTAKTVTLSFWVRSSLTGTFGASLTNSGNTRNYPFTYTISSANTWEYKTVTIPGDTTGTWLTTNGVGCVVIFSLGIGSGTYVGTAGAWNGTTSAIIPSGTTSVVGTNGATFYITGVQIENGTQATAFDYRPYGTELALCQRYFQKFENLVSDPNGSVGTGSVWTSTVYFMVLPYTVPMRALPTGSSSASNSITLLVNGAAKQASAVTFQQYSKVAVEVLGTSSSMTAGQAGFVRFTAAADFLALSAEL
jgi:hypothetical protein